MNPKIAEWIVIFAFLLVIFLIVRYIAMPLAKWIKRNKRN